MNLHRRPRSMEHGGAAASRIAARRGSIAAALLACATLAVYSPVVGFDFVNYDDPIYVSKNAQAAQGLSVQGLRWAFRSTQGAAWSPITRISHLLDVSLYGLDPAGHHATNLLLHTLNTLLLFAGLRALTGALWRSALVAALFALHPVNVESVAWVAERKGVLSTTGWLLATGAYVGWTRHGGARRLALATLLLALGLMAKPMLVTLPLTLLLLDAWPLGRWGCSVRTRDRVLEKWPFFLVVAGMCAVALVVQRPAMGLGIEPVPLHLRLANAASSAVRYLELAVWPTHLAVLHPHPYIAITGGAPLGALRVLAACIVLVALSYALLLRWRRPWTRTGWLWYLVTLLPVIGLVQIGHHAYAERYAYVPLIGIFLIVAWAAEAVAHRGVRWRRGVIAASVTVLVALGIGARAQLRYWKDSTALFTRAVEVSPGSGVVHHNLALAYAQAGRTDEALLHFERAIEVEPYNPLYLNNLGQLYRYLGRPWQAIPYHRRAIAVGPRNAVGKNLLGEAYEAVGMLDEAIASYRAALEVRPSLESAARNLERAERRRKTLESPTEQKIPRER